MKYLIISIVVVIALAIATTINLLKKSRHKKMVFCIQNNDLKSFESICENKLTKFLFPEMFLDSLRLDVAMMNNNKMDVNKYLDRLSKARLSESDKDKIYSQAFNYFLSCKDYNVCKVWHSKIQELKNERLKLENDKVYDIYIEKGYKYLDDMLLELEDIEPVNAGVNEFLISLMYKNKGDLKKQKEFESRSKQHLSMLDKEIADKNK